MTKAKQVFFGFRATILLYAIYTLFTIATITIMTMLDRQFVSESFIRFTYMLFFIFTISYTPGSQKIGTWRYIKENFALCSARLAFQVACALASIAAFFTFAFFVLDLPSVASLGESDLSGNNFYYFIANFFGLVAYFHISEGLASLVTDKLKPALA